LQNKVLYLDNNEGSFGELALLYHQPRLATIRALTDGKLWRMNREIFSKVARFVAFKKRQRHLEFIKNCQILQSINEKEMLDVADALKSEEYKRGDTIIREGDVADASNKHFLLMMIYLKQYILVYFVKSGSVEIRIRDSSNKSDYVIVKTCQPGDYFGERALLYNERRAATAVATMHCQLLVLDRADFNRLLGSAKDVLKRNAEHYKTVVKDIQNKHM
jgi:cAMP-dependent protein kinase regulator